VGAEQIGAGLGALESSAEQWVALAGQRELQPNGHRVLVCGAVPVHRVRQLADALRRLRGVDYGPATRAGFEALQELEATLSDLPADRAARLLQCAGVIAADFRSGDATIERLGVHTE
jgi:hypothetical protein